MSLLGTLGGLAGFALGGPAGAALGAGLGTAVGGGNLQQDLSAAGLSYLGGSLGQAAGIGGGVDMGGAQGLSLGGGGAGLAEMGGAQGLTLGGASGASLGDIGSLGGFGSSAIGDLGGLGSAGLYSLGGGVPTGAGLELGGGLGGGTTELFGGAGGGGGLLDTLRQQFGRLGFGGGAGGGGGLFGGMPSGLRTALGGMQLLGGLQQYQAGRERLAQQRGYAQQIQNLMANPSAALTTPGYLAGEQAVRRSMASQGYQGSGNMAAALAGVGASAYQNQLANLAALQGTSAPVASPMMALGNIGLGAYGLFA